MEKTLFSSKVLLFNSDAEVLLLLDEDGKWDLPGGEIELGENPIQAAIRETHEETSILLSEDSLYLVPDNPRMNRSIHYEGITHARHFFAAHVGKLLLPRAAIKLSDEHTAYEWAKLNVAKNQISHTVKRQALNDAIAYNMFRTPTLVEQI